MQIDKERLEAEIFFSEMTLTKLARKSGLAESVIYHALKTGRCQIKTVGKLSKALNVDYRVLCGSSPTKEHWY